MFEKSLMDSRVTPTYCLLWLQGSLEGHPSSIQVQHLADSIFQSVSIIHALASISHQSKYLVWKLCQLLCDLWLYNGDQGRRCGLKRGLKHTNEVIRIHEAVWRVCEVRKGPPIVCRKHDLASSLVLALCGLWLPRHASPRHING